MQRAARTWRAGWRLWRDWRPDKTDGRAASARPGQAIDMLFLAAQAGDARQIHPLLRFYDAVDLPVYATGAVYETDPDTERDHDLRDLVFCDAVPDASARPAQDTVRDALPRLHRMGRDAYRLSQALPNLMIQSGLQLAGATGTLYMDNFRAIRRQPDCHRIAIGKLLAAG